MYDTRWLEAPDYIPELKGLTKNYHGPDDKINTRADSRLKDIQVRR